jgi:hypothetical protein
MLSNRNLRIQNAFTLGSPPPTLACPYCPRHFRSTGGRTKHIRAKHQMDGSGCPEPNPSRPPSPMQSLLQPPPGPPSPVPFNSPTQLPPLCRGLDHADLDTEHPYSDPEYALSGFYSDIMNEDPPPASSQDIPLSVTRAYHPKLDGKSIFLKFIQILTLLSVGRICDENGDEILPNTPPPPRNSDNGPHWTPYNSRLEFEVADFLFRRNQMSAGDINFLLGLWAASLAVHGDEPPFSNATDMYNTIDSTPLGDLTWESFRLQYNGTRPLENVPSWMEAEYDVWFRDPRILVHNLLSNPDFKSDFDYAPFQEHTTDGTHRFQDFMSGNWAWMQAVSLCHHLFDLVLILVMKDIIAEDPQTHGSVFCPIILGSDKTTVSVATGHNEYWPVYLSIGNIHNNIRRAHRNGVVLLSFLAIPKCKSYVTLTCISANLLVSFSGS